MSNQEGGALDSLVDEDLLQYLGSKHQQEVFHLLYDRYEKRVYFKCLSMLKSEQDARDLTHDIFIKIFTKLNQFKGNSKLSLWIHSISTYSCLSFLDKTKKIKAIIQDESTESLINFVDDGKEELQEKLMLEIRLKDLENLLNQLKEEERLIIIMKYIDGLPVKEIASILELSESAIKMKLKRTRDKLYDMFKTSNLA